MGYVPPGVRSKIMARDGERCMYCGWHDALRTKFAEQLSTDPTVKNKHYEFHVDHILAESRGGDTDESNLAVTCGCCNMRKNALRDGPAFVAYLKSEKYCQDCLKRYPRSMGPLYHSGGHPLAAWSRSAGDASGDTGGTPTLEGAVAAGVVTLLAAGAVTLVKAIFGGSKE